MGVCFSQMSVIFAGDLVAVHISGMSTIARCLQPKARVDCRLETFLSHMNIVNLLYSGKKLFWGMGSRYKCWVQLLFMCPLVGQAEDAAAYLMICVCLLVLWPLIIFC